MIIIVWGGISFALGFWLIGKGLEFNRRKGAPFFFIDKIWKKLNYVQSRLNIYLLHLISLPVIY